MFKSLRHSAPMLLFLAVVMALTRVHHFSALPDASWAVFFVGGFYLHRHWPLALPVFFGVAVLADAWAISRTGTDFWSHYCLSPAYWFLIPSYLVLWFGGRWLARRHPGLQWLSLARLIAAVLISVGLCYVISNGSFYWLSDSWLGTGRQRSLGGWLVNLGHWYWPFLKVTAIYVTIAALLHAAALGAGLGRHVSPQAGTAP